MDDEDGSERPHVGEFKFMSNLICNLNIGMKRMAPVFPSVYVTKDRGFTGRYPFCLAAWSTLYA